MNQEREMKERNRKGKKERKKERKKEKYYINTERRN